MIGAQEYINDITLYPEPALLFRVLRAMYSKNSDAFDGDLSREIDGVPHCGWRRQA